MDFFKKILNLFSAQERFRLIGLAGLIIIMGLVEVMAIGLMVPFMATLANPEIITTNRVLQVLYEYSHATSANRFIFGMGVLIFSVLVLGNAFSALVNWLSLRFCWIQGFRLEKRLFEQYLSQPYIFFLDKNSTELTRNILTEVQRLLRQIVMPSLDVLKAGFVACCIIILLFVIDPFLALIVAGVLGGVYSLIFILLRTRTRYWSKQAAKERAVSTKLVGEALAGIKDIKLSHQEHNAVETVAIASRTYARQEANAMAAAAIPRYILEGIAFGGILLIILYLLGVKHEFKQVLPLIALYVFAGYRLMPLLQIVFSGLTQIRYNQGSLDKLYADLDYLEQHRYLDLQGNSLIKEQPITFTQKISLDNLSFYYPTAKTPALSSIQLTININTMIGFVGRTGSGKTTLIDILLGLLEPNSGDMRVDDNIIDSSNRRSWQKNLGYVSQHAYLNDDTIANNIAFTAGKNVDMDKVIMVAKIAKIHDFIMQELPDAYNTTIGERGVRLSGGQRQRICIARALYHDPKVLVLDEATSALDNETEHAVMESIRSLGKTKTIILIAHRLTTVKACDNIFVLDKGHIVGQGTFETLLADNEIFQLLAREKNERDLK